MNVIIFAVKKITNETAGKDYEIFNATEKERKKFTWLEDDFVKQECITVDEGGEQKEVFFHNITRGENPYKVGDKGLH